MTVFASNQEMSIDTLVEAKPIKAGGENFAYPIRDSSSDSSSIKCASSKASEESMPYSAPFVDANSLSDDDSASKVDDESATYGASESGNEADEESVAYTASESQSVTDDESATSSASKTSINQILKGQTEETRLMLIDIAEDTRFDDHDRSFAGTMADIMEWWQHYAGDENPTSFQIDFGLGSQINLLMVLALLPEKFQAIIRIDDEHRSPSSNGEDRSWLHEQTTDVLVQLSVDPNPASVFFGQGLASMVRDSVDEGWRVFTGRSWLEDQIHLWSNDELEPDLYRFPPGTAKIVFLFNPTEIHWTVVEVHLEETTWTYTLYNSLSKAEQRLTLNACREQMPLLEKLICGASGFDEPVSREIVVGHSAQQMNTYDCGPIAVYNAVELLEGRRPSVDVDTEQLRLRYLGLILDTLHLLSQGLDLSAFRAYMRKACLDYVI